MTETTEAVVVRQNGNGLPAPSVAHQPTPTPALGHLARALATVQQKCRAVAKDARNEYHRYNYASSEAVITEAQRALAESGLAVLPVRQVLDGWQREGENRFELRRHFLLVHASGESMPLEVAWPVCPEKGRPLDKATAIAATLSLAYLLRDLCLMPRVDPSDELAGREDRPQPAAKVPPRKAPAPLPTDGPEMLRRLQVGEAKLVAAGRCKAQELLAHVSQAGKNRGYPPELVRYAGSQIAWAMEEAKRFRDEHKQPAPQPTAP